MEKKKPKSSEERDFPKNDAPILRDIEEPNFRTLRTPFRMAKLNLVWSKAQHVSPLFAFNTLNWLNSLQI